jgi:uncharacterized protein YraI
MQQFKLFWVIFVILILWPLALIAQQSTGVTAQAQNTVNIRSEPNIDSELLGQMTIGTEYPVVGRSEFFPWVLLGDPITLQNVGWVFRDIVTLQGNVQTLPISTSVITNSPATATTQPQQPQTQSANQTPAAPSPVPSSTPAFTVAGTVQGEVNIRYGPGTNYPRVGVAQAGERFQITAWHTQLPWVQIRYDDSPTDEAWIALDLLDVQGDIYTLQAISTTNFNLPTLTPTPSVVQSSAGTGNTSAPLSAAFVALGNQLWQRLLQMKFDPQTSRFASLFLVDLQTGEAITFGDNVAYRGTSVNKISILAALYGHLSVPPTQPLATDIANTMICSETSATNRLLSIIGDGDEWQGSQEVTNFLTTLGLTDSFLLAPYTVDLENPPIPPYPIPVPQTSVDQQQANPEPYNQLTVDDMGWLLSAIYQCGYEESGPLIDLFPAGTYEPRECRQMLHVMSNNTVDSLLKTGVPEETRFAHKHGWVNDTHTNAGIFFTPGGDYALVMAFHSTQLDATGERYLSFSDTQPAFAETSRSVYNYFNPDNPMTSVRTGFIPEASVCNFAGTPLVTDLQQAFWDE